MLTGEKRKVYSVEEGGLVGEGTRTCTSIIGSRIPHVQGNYAESGRGSEGNVRFQLAKDQTVESICVVLQ